MTEDFLKRWFGRAPGWVMSHPICEGFHEYRARLQKKQSWRGGVAPAAMLVSIAKARRNPLKLLTFRMLSVGAEAPSWSQKGQEGAESPRLDLNKPNENNGVTCVTLVTDGVTLASV